MIELTGKYNTAKVYTDNIEETAISQLINLLNQEYIADSKIRIMPDVHAGAGCTIGTTLTIQDKVCPNLVGVDIGCGMLTTQLTENDIDLEKLDAVIRSAIPSGHAVRQKTHKYAEDFARKGTLQSLKVWDKVQQARALMSIGTLGGGNHFIEVSKDGQGHLFLVIHSGSRHLGLEVAKLYQLAAYNQLNGDLDVLNNRAAEVNEIISRLKAAGRHSEIESAIKEAKGKFRTSVPKALAYVSSYLFDDYLHDMNIMQQYAALNRAAMAKDIITAMGWSIQEQFETIHNYIDLNHMILRKGAISAQKGEQVLIPMNMRDGSLICIGKGNPDWNFSAPHGAGRLMSRGEAKRKVALEDFEKSMEGIFSTTVNSSTLDESPFAYKPIDEILSNIGDTVDVVKQIKPIYNFKAAE